MSSSRHDSETPAHGQQVISAVAFVHRKNDKGQHEVFLPRRADTKKFLPGMLEMPGGHIDFGEHIDEGLKREFMEELNMEVSLGDVFEAFTYVNIVKGSHSIEVVYFGRFSSPLDQLSINPEDHSEYVWLTKEEVIKRKDEIIPESSNTDVEGHEEDPEYLAILRGFELLEQQQLNFG